MHLSKIAIENFRGFEQIEIDFELTTVLVGENNTGKSSVLEAIRFCLSRALSRRGNPFEDHDYFLPKGTSRPGDAGKLVVTIDFSETTKGEWVPDIVQALPDVAVLHGSLYHVTFRLTSEYDKSVSDFVSDWDFLDPAGKPIPKGKRTQVLVTLQQLNPVHYLSALRDAAREFQSRSTFWAPFLRSPTMAAADQAKLEKELADLNQKILKAEPRLKGVVDTLAKAQKLVRLGTKDTVSIEALPTRVWEMLSRAQVNVAGMTGANLPLSRHGAGTQSLSVIFLFQAFLEAGLGGSDPLSAPILEIEEPEAHLHPSAVRVLWRSLDGIKGQKIIASHSGDLLSEAPLQSLRRLYRKGGKIAVGKIQAATLNADEQRKVHFHIRRTRGELLFARCWLLVEGETDYWVVSECARVLNVDLEEQGIRIVEYAQVGAATFVKVSDDLGIEWFCLCDGDTQGKATEKSVGALLKGKTAGGHVLTLPEANMELFLCKAGHGAVYKTNVSPQKSAKITAKPGDPQYWSQVLDCQQDKFKVPCAIKVVENIAKQGKKAVPKEIDELIKASVKLATN
jgi:putative ATP-dependent endonuclease of OLD family